MAISIAKGMEKENVIATYKHFPGYGKSQKDAHLSLPIIDKDYKYLMSHDLVPFKNAILENAKMIMVGHEALPKITNDNIPASLNKKIITDILINELEFNGLIITDALNMKAVCDNYSDDDIAVMAINAGADILLMPNDPLKYISYIKENVSEDIINSKVKKILKFKYLYLNNDSIYDSSLLNDSSYNNVIDKIKE